MHVAVSLLLGAHLCSVLLYIIFIIMWCCDTQCMTCSYATGSHFNMGALLDEHKHYKHVHTRTVKSVNTWTRTCWNWHLMPHTRTHADTLHRHTHTTLLYKNAHMSNIQTHSATSMHRHTVPKMHTNIHRHTQYLACTHSCAGRLWVSSMYMHTSYMCHE